MWLANISMSDPGRPPIPNTGTTVRIVESWQAPVAGATRTIHVLTNAPLVQLFVNDAAQGSPLAVPYFLATVVANVTYAAGTLTAKALAADGVTVLATHSTSSWGAPASLALTMDVPSLATGTGSAVFVDGADVALLRAAAAPPSFCDPGAGWAPSWADEFDGDTLDPASWNVRNDSETGSCREAWCSPANVAVGGGALRITTRREAAYGFNYTTGAVTTLGKREWPSTPAYRLCVSAVLPGGKGAAGQGVWPAAWMMPATPSCDPDLGEYDVMEVISGTGVGYATYHWETTYPSQPCAYPKGHESVSAGTTLPDDWNSAYHEYAMERAATHVAYVYDGVTVLNRSSSGGPAPVPELWPDPFYLILNTALGGPWPGSPNASTVLPATYAIDYVRVVVRA